MGWGLTRWIVSVRSVQLLGAFIPGALNGWLLHYIYSQDGVGLAHSMIVLQILVRCLQPAAWSPFNMSSFPSENLIVHERLTHWMLPHI